MKLWKNQSSKARMSWKITLSTAEETSTVARSSKKATTNMFLNAPNAIAQMRGHTALRRNSLFDNYPLSERRPVITSDDLTEEEMAALWVDIFKPLDVMGMILSHENKTTSQHGQ